MTKLENVIAESKVHFLANGRLNEVYVIQNDERIYYCDGSNLNQFHVRDSENGLHPIVCGDWSNDNFLGCKKPLGYSWKSLI